MNYQWRLHTIRLIICGYVHGRRSLFLNLKEYNPRIKYSLSRIRAKKYEPKKKIAEKQIPPKQLKEYFTPATYDAHTSTHIPIATGPFEIKHSLIQMVPPFYGLESENYFKNVDAFSEICFIVFLNNVLSDALQLYLFPFSWKDKGKAWLDTKTNITTWDQMQKEFLKTLFSIGKPATLRHAVTNVSQNKNEPLQQTWKDLKNRCKVILTMRSLCGNSSKILP